ncbi:MAG: V-type ATPase subunit [Spirochaetes bacterium]|nr:V-type ATPase subunit [Spirochaetota bacterium]
MFKDLSKYGFLNAKIRSKIGNLLDDDEFEEMRAHKSYYEIINFLVEKEYISHESKVSDIKEIEFELFKLNLQTYQDIYFYTRERKLKKFIFHLLEKLEVENFKNILRSWTYKERDIDLDEYIYKERICYDIPAEKLLASDDIEEFRSQVSHTPFFSDMTDALGDYKKTNSLFYLEIALDKGYYSRIFSSLDLLTGRDQKIVKKFIGFEIDVQNLIHLIRFKNYYDLNPALALKNVISSGYRFSQDFLSSFYSSTELKSDILGLFSGLPKFMASEFSNKIKTELSLKNKMMLIEDLLMQVLMNQVRNTLTGYPFTIGIIIVYLLLKHLEIKNIISILNLKYYELI